MEEVEVGLVVADVLTVRRCWLEEGWLVLLCQSVGSSSQTEDF